uniref:Candidate secreted effector n=1 Tax=Meloidogyne incognita TaxID=6306 RepID=A0A914MWM5_MELIC
MNPRKNRYRLRQSSLGGSPEDSPQHSSRSLYPQSARGNAFTKSQKSRRSITFSLLWKASYLPWKQSFPKFK